ncbi:MAG: alpha/beta hydrolase [Deltaproteobacteria bacterium]|nr:alpha/beta hydrolase [Deltaproteobacteria bacterium]
MKNRFIGNGDVVIHAIEKGSPQQGRPTLVCCMGLWESAERALELLSVCKGHAVAFSFRGRGLSSTPAKGYDLESHVSDLEAVISSLDLKSICLLGFSRGGAYALGYAIKRPGVLQALILVDQPPRHTQFGKGSVEFWANLIYQGVPVINHIRLTAINGLGKEARQIDFANELSQLTVPVALFVGRSSDSSIPSDLSEQDLECYEQQVSGIRLLGFPKAGHMIPDEDPVGYVSAVNAFLDFLGTGGKEKAFLQKRMGMVGGTFQSWK